VPVTCSVKATNAMGTSASSAASNQVVPFQALLTLTVMRQGAGAGLITSTVGTNCTGSGNTNGTCITPVVGGTTVTFTAATVNGSLFNGWLTGGKVCAEGRNDLTTCTLTFNVSGGISGLFLNTAVNPQPPIAISAVAGPGSAIVSFAANFSGGAAVYKFKVLCSPGEVEVEGPSSPITVTGLAAGVPVTCKVRTYTTVGPSAWSVASNSVTPIALTSLTVQKTGAGQGTVTSLPSGISCGATCSATYQPNTTVRLAAVAAAGSVFQGWTGVTCNNGNSGSSCTFSLTANTTVQAQFGLAQGTQARRYDVTGDGTSDVIWYNSSTFGVTGMNANGLTLGSTYVIDAQTSADWKVLGFGDLNGDGKADLVWYNTATGEVYGLLQNGGTTLSEGRIYLEADLNWKPEHIADLDGDGRSDLVWKNQTTGQIYVMPLNGLSVLGGQIVYTEPNLSWKIVATGDLNGDGRADLLLRNSVTGDVGAILMDGFSVVSAGLVYTEPNLSWQIVGLADYDGDGKADILWRNATTGEVYQMRMNGLTVAGGQLIYSVPDTNWKVIAMGDYNGDGKADVLYHNSSTGQVYMLLMDGFTILSEGMVHTEPDTNWKIVGP
jgi:hypothetical protein